MNRLARSSIEPESQLLWGGGASVQLPENIKFYDVSRFRHVPDHQEVFIEANEQALDGDRSLIFEVVELPVALGADHDTLAEFCWDDYVKETDAQTNFVFSTEKLDLPYFTSNPIGENYQCVQVTGVHASASKQLITAQRNTDVTWKPTTLSLGILRLPRCKADILISFHIPGPLLPSESAIHTWHMSDVAQLNLAYCASVHKAVLESFRVLDEKWISGASC